MADRAEKAAATLRKTPIREEDLSRWWTARLGDGRPTAAYDPPSGRIYVDVTFRDIPGCEFGPRMKDHLRKTDPPGYWKEQRRIADEKAGRESVLLHETIHADGITSEKVAYTRQYEFLVGAGVDGDNTEMVKVQEQLVCEGVIPMIGDTDKLDRELGLEDVHRFHDEQKLRGDELAREQNHRKPEPEVPAQPERRQQPGSDTAPTPNTAHHPEEGSFQDDRNGSSGGLSLGELANELLREKPDDDNARPIDDRPDPREAPDDSVAGKQYRIHYSSKDVEYETTQMVVVSISGERIVFDFLPKTRWWPNEQHRAAWLEMCDEETERWEGRITWTDDGQMSLEGNGTSRSRFHDERGGRGWTKATHRIQGALVGDRLQGTMNGSGAVKATQVEAPASYDFEGTWWIDGFEGPAPPEGLARPEGPEDKLVDRPEAGNQSSDDARDKPLDQPDYSAMARQLTELFETHFHRDGKRLWEIHWTRNFHWNESRKAFIGRFDTWRVKPGKIHDPTNFKPFRQDINVQKIAPLKHAREMIRQGRWTL